MADIPLARSILREALSLDDADAMREKINSALDVMYRVHIKRRSANESTPMSRELAADIRAYHRAHPDFSAVRIGEHFNVNPGRVSEAISGSW